MAKTIELNDLDGTDTVRGLEGFQSLRVEDLLGVAGGMKPDTGYLSSATNDGDSDPIKA